MSAAERLVAAATAVDHLLLGVAHLDQGVEWVEKLTGVKAVPGGSHPGVGTRNALLSLGGRQYLEIIAPDPRQAAFNYHIDLRALAEPRLVNWAALSNDLQATAKDARAAGFELFGPRDGARSRPDGKTLQWKTLGVINQFGVRGVEPFPFFIEWNKNSLHPSQDSPRGCALEGFDIEHPEPDNLAGALRRLGIEAGVKHRNDARLIATLKTPKGTVKLS